MKSRIASHGRYLMITVLSTSDVSERSITWEKLDSAENPSVTPKGRRGKASNNKLTGFIMGRMNPKSTEPEYQIVVAGDTKMTFVISLDSLMVGANDGSGESYLK